MAKYLVWSYKKILPEVQLEYASDTAWHNMAVADKHFNLAMFLSSASGWFNANPGKFPDDLERELRERNYNTHLFAVQTKLQMEKAFGNADVPGVTSMFKSGDEKTDNLDYVWVASIRPPPLAAEEVASQWASQDENLAALHVSGLLTVAEEKASDIDKVAKGNLELLEPKKIDMAAKLMKNEVRLKVTLVSGPEMLELQSNEYLQSRAGTGLDARLVYLETTRPDGQKLATVIDTVTNTQVAEWVLV
jgi:hypothetical protein